LHWAEKAVHQRDAHLGYQTLRGMCLSRVARHREAVEVLETAYRGTPRDNNGRTSLNRYFAAMSYHQLGDTEKAKECYEDALKLPKSGTLYGLDLSELARAEYEKVLNTKPEE
jgi:tetratricopeptide (TPR) repeat protein